MNDRNEAWNQTREYYNHTSKIKWCIIRGEHIINNSCKSSNLTCSFIQISKLQATDNLPAKGVPNNDAIPLLTTNRPKEFVNRSKPNSSTNTIDVREIYAAKRNFPAYNFVQTIKFKMSSLHASKMPDFQVSKTRMLLKHNENKWSFFWNKRKIN